MLTTIVVVLALVAVIAVAAWWFFDFDMPEVEIPAAVPGVGAGILYRYWGPLAWATVALLAVIAGYCIYRLVAGQQREDNAAKRTGRGRVPRPWQFFARVRLVPAVAGAGKDRLG